MLDVLKQVFEIFEPSGNPHQPFADHVRLAFLRRVEGLCHACWVLGQTFADGRVNRIATRRLQDKGLVTQQDGGYLTSLRRNAVDHAHAALALLTEGSAHGAATPKHEVAPDQQLPGWSQTVVTSR